jgi:hypothetical protein
MPGQVGEVAAVAQGDLLETVRLKVEGRPLKGEFLESATIVNTMIRELGVFSRTFLAGRSHFRIRSGFHRISSTRASAATSRSDSAGG